LHLGQKLGSLCRRSLVVLGVFDLVEGCGDDLLLAPGNPVLILLVSSATASAGLLRLRVLLLEGLRLDKEHVGLRGGARILGGGV